jgi:hypothetical protein
MAKDEERERRLAEALRANLRRRKQQQREGDLPQRPNTADDEPNAPKG